MSKRNPVTVMCYICAKEYGSLSIKFHIKSCQKKWAIQQDKLPLNEQKPCPEAPANFEDFVLIAQGKKRKNEVEEDIEVENAYFNQAMLEYNRAAFDNYQAFTLLPCVNCGRSFNKDALVKHQKACTAQKPFKQKSVKKPKQITQGQIIPKDQIDNVEIVLGNEQVTIKQKTQKVKQDPGDSVINLFREQKIENDPLPQDTNPFKKHKNEEQLMKQHQQIYKNETARPWKKPAYVNPKAKVNPRANKENKAQDKKLPVREPQTPLSKNMQYIKEAKAIKVNLNMEQVDKSLKNLNRPQIGSNTNSKINSQQTPKRGERPNSFRKVNQNSKIATVSRVSANNTKLAPALKTNTAAKNLQAPKKNLTTARRTSIQTKQNNVAKNIGAKNTTIETKGLNTQKNSPDKVNQVNPNETQEEQKNDMEGIKKMESEVQKMELFDQAIQEETKEDTERRETVFTKFQPNVELAGETINLDSSVVTEMINDDSQIGQMGENN